MNTNYREYVDGDTVRVTGYQGRLFSSCGRRELAEGVELGVICKLERGEDFECDVRLPDGILSNGDNYISIACIELVESAKKSAIIKHKEEFSLFEVSNPDDTRWLAKIWYDGGVPKDVAEKAANDIKAAYDAVMN